MAYELRHRTKRNVTRGTHYPLGATLTLVGSCSGQVLLAHLDRSDRDSLLQSLQRPRGLSRERLLKDLERIHRQGYELRQSPITAGVTDVSYPVRGFDGRVMAALTVPYLRVLDNSLPTTVEQTRRLVEDAARRISRSLGWMH